jgi:hypothetical protein
MKSQEADVHGVSEIIALPEDPENGEIFKAPGKTHLGGSIVINVFRGKELLGSALRLESAPVSSRKYQLTRMTSSRILKKGDLLNVKITHNAYSELIFREGYGWMGHGENPSAEVMQNNYFRVTSFLLVGPFSETTRLYEYVCMDKIKEKK